MLNKILTITSEVCNVPALKMMGRERTRNIVIARQLYCYIATQYFGHTLKETGKGILKDHTTVIHSIRHVKRMIEINDELTILPLQNILSRLKEETKTEIKFHIKFNYGVNPMNVITDLLKMYDCSVNIIY